MSIRLSKDLVKFVFVLCALFASQHLVAEHAVPTVLAKSSQEGIVYFVVEKQVKTTPKQNEYELWQYDVDNEKTSLLTSLTGDRSFSLKSVSGLAYSQDRGEVFIVDRKGAAIYRYDLNAGELRILSDATSGRGPRFGKLGRVAWDPIYQRLLVIDVVTILGRVQRMLTGVAPDTGMRTPLVGRKVGRGVLRMPADLALDTQMNRAFLSIPGGIMQVDLYSGDRTIFSDALTGVGLGVFSRNPAALAIDYLNNELLTCDNELQQLMRVSLAAGDRDIVNNSAKSPIDCTAAALLIEENYYWMSNKQTNQLIQIDKITSSVKVIWPPVVDNVVCCQSHAPSSAANIFDRPTYADSPVPSPDALIPLFFVLLLLGVVLNFLYYPVMAVSALIALASDPVGIDQNTVVEAQFPQSASFVTDSSMVGFSAVTVTTGMIYRERMIEVLSSGNLMSIDFWDMEGDPSIGQVELRVFDQNGLISANTLHYTGRAIPAVSNILKENNGNLLISSNSFVMQISSIGDVIATYNVPTAIDRLQKNSSGSVQLISYPQSDNNQTLSIYDGVGNLLWSETESNLGVRAGIDSIDQHYFVTILGNGDIMMISSDQKYTRLDALGNIVLQKTLEDKRGSTGNSVFILKNDDFYRTAHGGVARYSAAGVLLWEAYAPGLVTEIDNNEDVYRLDYATPSVWKLNTQGGVDWSYKLPSDDLGFGVGHWGIIGNSYHLDGAGRFTLAYQLKHRYDLATHYNKTSIMGLDYKEKFCSDQLNARTLQVACAMLRVIPGLRFYEIVNGRMTAIYTIEANGVSGPTQYAVDKNVDVIGSDSLAQFYYLGAGYHNLDAMVGYGSMDGDNFIISR